MKKLLLIGELNIGIEDLKASLECEFRVQLCSMHLEGAEKMIKIAKPDLIIMSLAADDDINDKMFDMLSSKYTKIPVLAVGNKEAHFYYLQYYEKNQFERLEYPIAANVLLEKCYEQLNVKRSENSRLDAGENTKNARMNYKEKPQNGKKQILVVDDSALVLRNIKAMLEPKYNVFVANSGEQALKFIPEKNPDLILLDYEMPEMNGKEVFERIKADEISKDIPVIFLTGVADKEHIYAVLQLNPAGYFLKPPKRNKLLEAIENALAV